MLPPRAVEVLRRLLIAMSTDEELVLVCNLDTDLVGSALLVDGLDQLLARAGAAMTSQQVAELLNVSRPYVVKLAHTGKLPHVMVGNRHRFRMADVVEYRDAMKTDRADALRQLAPTGGYDDSEF